MNTLKYDQYTAGMAMQVYKNKCLRFYAKRVKTVDGL